MSARALVTPLARHLASGPRAGAPARLLGTDRLERAVGGIYQPDTERRSRYLRARLGQQFDAVLFHDRTTAVRPLP